MSDCSTGPIPRDEFKTLVDLPHGEARKTIRAKYDPLFGLEEGEKIEWLVTFRAEVEGTATVKAATKEEAEKLADNLPIGRIDWEQPSSNLDIDEMTIEPVRPRLITTIR